MLRRALSLLITLTATASLTGQSPVRALTFNIRYGTANDGINAWPLRRADVIATIRDHAPHLLGLQEALRAQLDEIGKALPGYREFGVGREDGKTKGEYAALLVDTLRFQVVGEGHFWFSDTPEVANSMTWGNRVTRICTWVRMVDRLTHDTLSVFNVHWDHESQPSREKSAALLLQRMRLAPPHDAILLFGDFNSDETNPAYRSMIADPKVVLHDTFRDVHAGAKTVGTFHAFKGDSTGGKIDFILAGPGWQSLDAGIDRRHDGPVWPSDHFPVWATLRRP